MVGKNTQTKCISRLSDSRYIEKKSALFPFLLSILVLLTFSIVLVNTVHAETTVEYLDGTFQSESAYGNTAEIEIDYYGTLRRFSHDEELLSLQAPGQYNVEWIVPSNTDKDWFISWDTTSASKFHFQDPDSRQTTLIVDSGGNGQAIGISFDPKMKLYNRPDDGTDNYGTVTVNGGTISETFEESDNTRFETSVQYAFEANPPSGYELDYWEFKKKTSYTTYDNPNYIHENPCTYTFDANVPTLVKAIWTLSSSTTGSLYVSSTPVGADVYVDDSYKGVTPITIPSLSAGTHSLKLTKSSYEDYTGTVSITAGQTTTKNVVLSTTTGSLSVSSIPTGATVYVDGMNVGPTPVTVFSLSAGIHALKLTKSNYDDYEEDVYITAGQTTSRSIDLSESPNTAPTASITSISPNPAIAGQSVSFSGTGSDTDGSVTGYKWISSIKGDLSYDPSFATSALSSGTHTIYFLVQDDDDAWSAADTMSLTINEPNIDADITLQNIDTGYYANGDKVRAYAQVTNTGDVAHTFYVGYSVQDPLNKWYDAPCEEVSLSPGQSEIVELVWTVPWLPEENLGAFDAKIAVWSNQLYDGSVSGQLDSSIIYDSFNVARFNGQWLRIKSVLPNEATRGKSNYFQITFENIGDEVFTATDATVTIQEVADLMFGDDRLENIIGARIQIPTLSPGEVYTHQFRYLDGIYFSSILTDYLYLSVEPENGNIEPQYLKVEPFKVSPHPLEYVDVVVSVVGTIVGQPELDEKTKIIFSGEEYASTLIGLYSDHLINQDYVAVGNDLVSLIGLVYDNPVSAFIGLVNTGTEISELIVHHAEIGVGMVERFAELGYDISSIIADCPINLIVVDETGNRLGIDENGTIYEEIPNSSVLVFGNETNRTVLLLFPPDLNYTTVVTGNDNGTFDLFMTTSLDGEVSKINYTNVPTINGSSATFDLNPTTDYTMSIDSNGDSILDNTTMPSSIEIYQLPEVTISSPQNGSAFIVGDIITFEGDAYDSNKNSISGTSLNWTSSLDGYLGSGTSIFVSNLSAGAHTIYLEATDSEEHSRINTTQIEIMPKEGMVNIVSNPSGAIVYLDGYATNQLTPCLISNVSGGYHQVELAKTGYNNWTTGFDVSAYMTTDIIAEMDLDVYPPEIFVSQPLNGSTTSESNILIMGSIETGSLLTVNGESTVITDNSFNATVELQRGINIIDLQASDVNGNSQSESLYVIRVNKMPAATISSISPSPALKDSLVSFAGTGFDSDGTVVGYSWTSSIDGLLSTSPEFSTFDLSLGSHVINFSVQDNEGEWSIPNSTDLQIYELAKSPIVSGNFDEWAPNSIWEISGRDFNGFYYDVDDNVYGEYLTLYSAKTTAPRTLDSGSLAYRTSVMGMFEPEFSFVEDDGFTSVTYPKIAFFGDEYVPIGGDASQISKLLIDDDSKHLLIMGESLELAEGYALTPIEVDIEGDKILFKLEKDGELLTEGIIDMCYGPYVKWQFEQDINDTTDVITLMICFTDVFQGYSKSVCVIEGIWQISDTPMIIKSGDKFGRFEVTNNGSDGTIRMQLSESLFLGSGEEYGLLGADDDLIISVADSETLRFSFAKEVNTSESYQVRGSLETIESETDVITWDPYSFTVFWYDLDSDLGSETLSLRSSDTRGLVIEEENLEYTSTIVYCDPKFNFSTQDDPNAEMKYYLLGFAGEPYVPLSGVDVSNISKLVMDNNDSYTLKANELLELADGYTLKPQYIDVDGTTVMLQLTKDGNTLGTKLINTSDTTTTEKTWYFKQDVDGTQDVVTLMIHVEEVFQDSSDELCLIQGIWQISDKAMSIELGDEFGQLVVDSIGSSIVMINDRTIVGYPHPGSEINLFANLNIRIADDDSTLRFYPYASFSDELPVASIDCLYPGTSFEGKTVNFKGHGTDPNGIIVNYSWESSIDGLLSSESDFTSSLLSAGNHIISFKVQNNDSIWSQPQSVDLSVLDISDAEEHLSHVFDEAYDFNAWNIGSTWQTTALDFSGFYYDPVNDLAGETLTVYKDGTGGSRTLEEGSLVYQTNIMAGFESKYPFVVDYDPTYTYPIYFTYSKIALFGDTYVTPVWDASYLHKLLIDDDNAYSLRIDESLELGEGYAITAKEIDVEGDKVWLELSKNGKVIDDEVISIYYASTWSFDQDIGDEQDVVTLMVHVNDVFQGSSERLCIIQGIWQISDRPMIVESGDSFGKMAVDSVGSWIEMELDEPITLTANQSYNLAGNLDIEVNDDSALRFYYLKYVDPNASTIVPFSNVAPTAEIITVSPNPAVQGNSVTFSGLGTDSDGEIVGYNWDSSIDGQLSTSSNFSTSSLSAGIHTISFSVQDDKGAWSGVESIILEIVDLTSAETISIEDALMFENVSKTIPVEFSNVANVSGCSFDLHYNSSVAIIENIVCNSDFTGISVTSNVNNSTGTANIVLTCTEPLTLSSQYPVILIDFNATGHPGTSTNIEMLNVEFSDTEFVPHTPEIVVNGSITIGTTGDFNNNDRIDIGDVSKVAFMVAGKVSEDLGADFNNNGRVDIGDASKIAFYLAGKVNEL